QIAKLASHQQRRDADSDRSEILATALQRLAYLEGLSVACEDDSQLIEWRVVDDRFEICPLRQRASDLCAIVMDDDRAACVDNRGEADVVAVDARLENRPE